MAVRQAQVKVKAFLLLKASQDEINATTSQTEIKAISLAEVKTPSQAELKAISLAEVKTISQAELRASFLGEATATIAARLRQGGASSHRRLAAKCRSNLRLLYPGKWCSNLPVKQGTTNPKTEPNPNPNPNSNPDPNPSLALALTPTPFLTLTLTLIRCRSATATSTLPLGTVARSRCYSPEHQFTKVVHPSPSTAPRAKRSALRRYTRLEPPTTHALAGLTCGRGRGGMRSSGYTTCYY